MTELKLSEYCLAGILAAALFLTGCEPPEQTWYYNQTLRQKLFSECLKNAPAGPQSTHYNDWSEIVDECGTQAEYMSVVDLAHRHETKAVEK